MYPLLQHSFFCIYIFGHFSISWSKFVTCYAASSGYRLYSLSRIICLGIQQLSATTTKLTTLSSLCHFLSFSDYSIFCKSPCTDSHGGQEQVSAHGNIVVPGVSILPSMAHSLYNPPSFTGRNNARASYKMLTESNLSWWDIPYTHQLGTISNDKALPSSAPQPNLFKHCIYFI